MSPIHHLRIGTRLAAGFGLLLVLMAASLGSSGWRFQDLAHTFTQIVDEDWTKARAVADVEALTRANARYTMELLLVTDVARAQAARAHIQKNKSRIDDALSTLDRLVRRPEGKAALASLKTDRAAYVASFSKVAQLQQSGDRDAAVGLLLAETLPAIDRLQAHVDTLAELQLSLVDQATTTAKGDIRRAQWVLGVKGASDDRAGCGRRLVVGALDHPTHRAGRGRGRSRRGWRSDRAGRQRCP